MSSEMISRSDETIEIELPSRISSTKPNMSTEAGAGTNIEYPFGEVEMAEPIHQVAMDGNVEELEDLLKTGVDPNLMDKLGRTPLHYVASIECRCTKCLLNAETCTKLLVSRSMVDVNAQDNEGNAPLHLAIHNQLPKCAEQLISAGADLSLKNDLGEELVPLLVKKLPDTMTYLLDECIVVDQNDPKHEKCVLKVDFSPLVGNPKFKTPDGRTCSLEYCSPKTRKEVRISWQREMKVLLSILENPATLPWRSKILTHPVVQIFMEQEWKRARKFFYSYFVFYVMYVLFYTGYILDVYLLKCPSKLFLVRNDTQLLNSLSTAGFVSVNGTLYQTDRYGDDYHEINDIRYHHPTSDKCEIVTGMGPEVAIILILTLILAATELGRLMITRNMYLRSFRNIGTWIFIALVFVTTVPNLARQKDIGPYQYQSAALTVVLAWAFILQQIGRSPSLGKYIEMFGVVLQSFGFFLLTFMSLFVAFALGFCILFPTRRAFRRFHSSLLKTFVMMTGEIDYNTMFYTYTNEEVKGSISAHILFTTFVFIVSIVLMNLVIGLTVQDIQKLQVDGELRRVSRLILELNRLECFIFSKRLPRRLGDKLKESISVLQPTKQGRREGLIFEFRPNSREDRSVPEHLKQEALQLVTVSYEKFRADQCSKNGHTDSEDVGSNLHHPPLMRRLDKQHYKLIALRSTIYKGGIKGQN